MRTRIVRVGNAHGVRIPDALLVQAGLTGEVEITAAGDALVVRRARKPREGWAEAFRDMARHGDDRLLDDAAPRLCRWDAAEWVWP